MSPLSFFDSQSSPLFFFSPTLCFVSPAAAYPIASAANANAFVLPGGKVFVYSGLLRVCRNEDALAAVLGHEVAHNTASHVAERLSAAWVVDLTAGSLFFLAGALPGLAFFLLWTCVGGFYIQDLLYYLPMGRKQESEADYIGLMMMAEACYDPRQAVGFWQRMEDIQQRGGPQVPEMLSSHPSVSLCPTGAWRLASFFLSYKHAGASSFSLSLLTPTRTAVVHKAW